MGKTSRNDLKGRQIFSPVTGCSFITSHSSGLRFVPFFKMSSGTAILPRSCKYPPRLRARIESSSIPRWRPNSVACSARRSQWPSVYGSRLSTMSPNVHKTESAVSSSSVKSLRRSRDLTRAINSSARTGLFRKSSAPASMPRTLSPLSLSPVISTNGIRRVAGFSFSSRQNSYPDLPGMITSERIRSGGWRRTSASASCALAAVTTSYPRMLSS